MQLKIERTGKGEWEREGAILGEGRGENVIFGHMVFHLFGPMVEYLVILFYIYSFLWIRSTNPA